MPIYRMTSEKLEEIPVTSFAQENIMERGDLQRLLRDKPDVLEEGLFVISEEFSRWQESGRSIDLLGLDAVGQLTVIELKRTESGDHAELQAIRYAAMVANMTMEQAIDAHRDYLTRRGLQGDPQELVEQHLENVESGEIYTEKPRIILVSGGFSTELTTSVLWLNDNFGLDIKCIRLQPYRNSEELLVEASQIIPLPEATDYLVRLREREEETGRRQPSPAKVVQGGSDFKETMESTPAEYRDNMDTLYNWAVGLEQEKLAQLVTTIGSANVTLGVVLPQGRRLVTITKYPYGTCVSLSLRTLRSLSPNTALQVEKMANLDPGLWSANVWDITEELLTVLRAAYREANGLSPAAEDIGRG